MVKGRDISNKSDPLDLAHSAIRSSVLKIFWLSVLHCIMKIFIVGFLLLFVKNEALPVTEKEEIPMTTITPVEDLLSKKDEIRYDQRQNGTENYRIHVDGLVLVVAPVEALLLASGAGGSIEENLSSLMGGENSNLKPDFLVAQPKPESSLKPDLPKPKQRSNVRLISLLTPLLKRLRN